MLVIKGDLRFHQALKTAISIKQDYYEIVRIRVRKKNIIICTTLLGCRILAFTPGGIKTGSVKTI